MLTSHEPSPFAAVSVPLTRRQLRDAERTTGRRGSARNRSTSPEVRDRTAPPSRVAPVIGQPVVAERCRQPKRRSYASQALSMLTMAFVATVTVATSLPANALLNSEDIDSAPVRAVAAETSEPAQSLTVANAQLETVDRETYTVEAYQEPVQVAVAGAVGTFSNNPAGAIQWPFSAGVPISGTFGYRIAPCSSGCSSDHKGVDFVPGAGTPVHAIAGGVVRYVESSDYGLGVHVMIDHMIDGHLVTSVYGHMQFGSLQVSQGQVVVAGQQIGSVGNTGASTGAHMHLEVHMEDGTPVDPYAWLKAHAG